MGATMYIHNPLNCLDTIAGPKLLAGFMDAPVIGLKNKDVEIFKLKEGLLMISPNGFLIV